MMAALLRVARPIVIGVALIAGIALALNDVPLHVRPVFWLLRDVDRGDLLQATKALEELGRRGGSGIAAELATRVGRPGQHGLITLALSDAFRAIGRPAVAPLAAVLEGGSPATRASAAIALGSTAHPDALPALARSLSGGTPEVRRSVVTALVTVPGTESERVLLEVLKGNDRELAYWAALSLGRRASAAGLPLIDSVCDELIKDAARRSECVRSIGKIGGPEAIGLLAARLGRERSAYVRSEIAPYLAKSDDPRAAAALDAAAAARQLEVIASGHQYFLRVQPPLDDQLVIDAYQRLGARDMSEAMLASGRAALVEAVKKEAASPIRRPKMIEVR